MPTAIALQEFWQRVYEEAIRLCDAVQGLPDQCECSDAAGHLEGRCRCCLHNLPAPGSAHQSENCALILSRLRADLSLFCQDFAHVSGPLDEAAAAAGEVELRRDVFFAASDLQRIVRAVDRVSDAVVGFRNTCSILELRGLKHRCLELRQHCVELNTGIAGAANRPQEGP